MAGAGSTTSTVAELVQIGRLQLGGGLLGAMAHEVNNVVQGMSAAVYLFQDCIEHGDPIEGRYLSDLEGVVGELAEMGKATNEFVRNTQEAAETIDMRELVDKAAGFLRSVGKLKTVSLEVSIGDDLPLLHWRSQELEYIVLAILNYAGDPSIPRDRESGVQLSVSGADGQLVLELRDTAKVGATLSPDPECGADLDIVASILKIRGGGLSRRIREDGQGTVLRASAPLDTPE